MRCMAATNSSRTAAFSAAGCPARGCADNSSAKVQTIAAPKRALSQGCIICIMLVDNVGMKSKVVAILETRTGAHLADLVARRGGVPMLAPALEEVPDIDPQAVSSLLARWRIDPFKICIFQTGGGTRALFAAADTAGFSAELQELLAASTRVVRGPDPR